MANNDSTLAIRIDIKAEEVEAANSVKELRQGLKELIDLQSRVEKGSENWKKLGKAINEVDDKLGSLNDGFQTLRGSGIERTEASFDLLKEGFTKFDTGKIKAGISGIGAAFKAIPIFLIIEGIKFLIEKFDELKNSGGLLGKVFKGIGDLITWISNGTEELAGWLGLIDLEAKKAGETLKKSFEAATKAIEKQSQAYDDQIAVAKAAGKSTVALEKAKQEAIIETNKKIVEQIIAFVRAGGEFNEERKKVLTKALEDIKAAKVQEQVVEATDKKDKLEKYKKYLEEKAKLDEEARKEKIAREKTLAEEEARDAAYFERLKQAEINAEANTGITEQQRLEGEALVNSAQNAEKEHNLEVAKLEGKKAIHKAEFAAAEQLLSSLSGLFSKNEKAANAFFLLDKALAIGKIIVSTRAGIAANSAAGAALSIPTAGASVVAAESQNVILRIQAAAGIATILATTLGKFGGSGGGGGNTSLGGGSSGGAGAGLQPPVIQSPSNSTTNVNPDGSIGKQTVKAIVVETDITDKQKKVNTIKETATF